MWRAPTKTLIAALLFAAPCVLLAGKRDTAVEYLDETTGATVTVALQPMIFALRQSLLAANARDYVSLTGAEVDRSGEQSVYLVGYLWSTIDRRGPAKDRRDPRRRMVLLADARPILLVPEADYPSDLQDDAHLSSPGHKYVARLAFRVSIEQLRFIAGSGSVVMRLGAVDEGGEGEPDAGIDTYELWQDGRASLHALTELIGTGS